MKKLLAFTLLSLSLILCVAGANWFFIGDNGPPPWTPSDKSGMLYWFRATDGIIKNGSNEVTQWNDKSVNAYNATETPPRSPVWTNAAAPNGKACILFNGLNNLEFASGIALAGAGLARGYFFTLQAQTQGGTWYEVFITNNTAVTGSDFSAFFSNDATYSDLSFNIYTSSSTTALKVASVDFISAVTNGMMNYTGGTVGTPASWQVYKSSVSQTVVTGGPGTSANNRNYIGDWSTASGGLGFKGYICEVGAYDSVLSPTDQTNMNTYQTGFWGN